MFFHSLLVGKQMVAHLSKHLLVLKEFLHEVAHEFLDDQLESSVYYSLEKYKRMVFSRCVWVHELEDVPLWWTSFYKYHKWMDVPLCVFSCEFLNFQFQ